MDFLSGVRERVFPVGRLDYHSEGLLLLTNDGEFATASPRVQPCPQDLPGQGQRDAHAGAGTAVPRGHPDVWPPDRAGGCAWSSPPQNPWYEVRLIEGRQNQVRIMFKHFGLLVEKLKRVKIGFLELGGLVPGKLRHLTPGEIQRFRKILKMES